MKTLFAFAAAAALVCAAGSASAVAKFSPASTAFTVTGKFDIIPPGGSDFLCPYSLTATTTSTGGVTVTGASFCAGVSAVGLPWTWKAVRVSYGHIMTNWNLVIPGVTCGPVAEPSTLRSSVLYVSGSVLTPAGCGLLSSGTTTPAITVVR
jgi:hypothetical protein